MRHVSDYCIQQINGTSADNLPTWGNWQWNTKFLSEEFHRNSAILQLINLAREDFHVMGSDAQLVILSIGLALRDISLVQFHEEGEIYAEDVPDWVKQSPHEFSTGQRLLTTWGQQLVDEEGSGDSLPMDKDIKGKKKAKMTGRPGRKRPKSMDESESKNQRTS